ncbi:hypothetical protein Patl1_36618 [Pistacia atlantica]|nr:hypothetical protein Patl1_36618 [Pistacia atlantica]
MSKLRHAFVLLSEFNGSLIRKYTYLSNDSSYSVAVENGVDILVLDNLSSDDDKKDLDHMHEFSDTSNVSSHPQSVRKRVYL